MMPISVIYLYAQTPQPVIKLPTTDSELLQWSADGRYIAWVENSTSQYSPTKVDNPNWKVYDTQTGQSSSSSVYPFLPQLTPAESQILSPEPPDGGPGDEHPKVVFVSPNGRYLVYAGIRRTVDDHSIWKLM